MAHLYDEPVRAQVAEIVLMYADSGGSRNLLLGPLI